MRGTKRAREFSTRRRRSMTALTAHYFRIDRRSTVFSAIHLTLATASALSRRRQKRVNARGCGVPGDASPLVYGKIYMAKFIREITSLTVRCDCES